MPLAHFQKVPWVRISAFSSRSVLPGPCVQSIRAFSTEAFRVAVVGSGPSAFYTVKYLLKAVPEASVDMLEALCTPYGLVRFGVAPDHPAVKLVENDFAEVSQHERFRFFGNVRVGRDTSVDQLRCMYHAVVLAYGAESERNLGVPGDALDGVFSARAFVNWYNGHPDFASADFGLHRRGDTAVIVGQGNVAMDVARILATPPALLATTDICKHALEALERSQIRRVLLLGRRGPAQAAFTIKEFRELTKIPGCRPVISKADMAQGQNAASLVEMEERAVKRKWDLMQEVADGKIEYPPALPGAAPVVVEFRFFLSPTRLAAEAGATALHQLVAQRTSLVGEPNKQKAQPTGEEVAVACGLAFSSVGYRAVAVGGVPFDDNKAVIPSEQGRVQGKAGVYVAGWLKRGPSGIIGTNIADAKETVAALVQDWQAGALPTPTDRADVGELLRARGIEVVNLAGWANIDRYEKQQGALFGKPREKLVRLPDLLAAARGEL